MTTWRRKRDGRPYADVKIAGKRRRISLLKRGEHGADVDDAECAHRAETAVRIWTQHATRAAAAPATPQTLEQLVKVYLQTVAPLRRRGAGATAREFRLAYFVRWCKAQQLVTVADLRRSPGWCDRYVRHLLTEPVGRQRQPRKPYTAHVFLAHVKAMFRFAYEREFIDEAIVRKWPRIPVPPRQPRAFTVDELSAILAYARQHSKHAAALEFVCRVGCRPSDAALLRWTDVNFAGNVIVFRQAKTSGLVEIPMVGGLRQLMLECRASSRGSGTVFETAPAALTCSISLICRNAVGRGSAKWIRAAVVSMLMNAGVDRLDIQRVTGHASDAIESYFERSAVRVQHLLETVGQAIDGMGDKT